MARNHAFQVGYFSLHSLSRYGYAVVEFGRQKKNKLCRPTPPVNNPSSVVGGESRISQRRLTPMGANLLFEYFFSELMVGSEYMSIKDRKVLFYLLGRSVW